MGHGIYPGARGKARLLDATLSFLRRQESRHRGDKGCGRYASAFAYRNPDYCGQRLLGWFCAPLELSGCEIAAGVHQKKLHEGTKQREQSLVGLMDYVRRIHQELDLPKVRIADLGAHRTRWAALPSRTPDSQQAVMLRESFALTGGK